MKAVFKSARPYADHALNLPVKDVESAIPYYERTLGFRIVSRQSSPHALVILGRDDVRIGLAENGGDPAQEGCFFEVDDVETAYTEVKGRPAESGALKIHRANGRSYRGFSRDRAGWSLLHDRAARRLNRCDCETAHSADA